MDADSDSDLESAEFSDSNMDQTTKQCQQQNGSVTKFVNACC